MIRIRTCLRCSREFEAASNRLACVDCYVEHRKQQKAQIDRLYRKTKGYDKEKGKARNRRRRELLKARGIKDPNYRKCANCATRIDGTKSFCVGCKLMVSGVRRRSRLTRLMNNHRLRQEQKKKNLTCKLCKKAFLTLRGNTRFCSDECREDFGTIYRRQRRHTDEERRRRREANKAKRNTPNGRIWWRKVQTKAKRKAAARKHKERALQGILVFQSKNISKEKA